MMSCLRLIKRFQFLGSVVFASIILSGSPAWATGPGLFMAESVVVDGQVVDEFKSVEAFMATAAATHFFTIEPTITHHRKRQNPSQLIRFVCLDSNGQTIPFCNMEFTLGKTDGTGGHEHNPGRPCGLLRNNDDGSTNGTSIGDSCDSLTKLSGNGGSDGFFTFTYFPPEVSGVVQFSGKGFLDDGTVIGTVRTTIGVSIDGLAALPDGANYDFTGEKAGLHTDTHYGQPRLNTLLKSLANNMANAFPGTVIVYNDSSLVSGGLFDAGDGSWTTVGDDNHSSHRIGEDVDISLKNLSEEAKVHIFEIMLQHSMFLKIYTNHGHLRIK